MPQMAPLMWTSLFTMFAALLMLSIIKISFAKKEISPGPTEKNSESMNQNKLNWKW